MNFLSYYEKNSVILMEGALGERLKREYKLPSDEIIALANIIYREGGKEALLALWKEYISIAKKFNLPFIATTPTRRANKERVTKAGFNEQIIFDNMLLLKQLKKVVNIKMFVGGLMGCKGDAYFSTDVLDSKEAYLFHKWQATVFADSEAEFLYAAIMPAISEALGMANAMEETGLPYIISFMIRENGCLIDGTTIHDAIKIIDAGTTAKPLCYMTNCVHPTVLYKALTKSFNHTSLVYERFHGIQANTSPLPPEKLDGASELYCSDCNELANDMATLKEIINLKIVGGCCGTDASHIMKIAELFSK